MSINFFTHFLEKHFLEKHFLEKHFLEKHFLEKHFLEKSVSKNTRVTLTVGQRYQKSKVRDAHCLLVSYNGITKDRFGPQKSPLYETRSVATFRVFLPHFFLKSVETRSVATFRVFLLYFFLKSIFCLYFFLKSIFTVYAIIFLFFVSVIALA